MHNCLSGVAGAPADAPYIGSVLAKLRPSQRSVASYVWLIKCVGDPVFCAPNIGTGGFLGTPYAPLFVGTAENNPATPGFKPPSDLFRTRPTCPPEPTEGTKPALRLGKPGSIRRRRTWSHGPMAGRAEARL